MGARDLFPHLQVATFCTVFVQSARIKAISGNSDKILAFGISAVLWRGRFTFLSYCYNTNPTSHEAQIGIYRFFQMRFTVQYTGARHETTTSPIYNKFY